MKLAHQIKLSVFSKQEDNEKDVLNSFLSLIPFNLEEEKLEIKTSTAEGFEHKRIKTLELTLTKEKHTNKFLENLINKLTDEQKQLILNQADSRLDENLKFFLRFDKDKLVKEDKLWLTDKGNCFHIKISIAAFPSKKEKALEVVKNLFK